MEGIIMEIALICTSSLSYLPFVGNYEDILKENNANFTIINWDRLHVEDDSNRFTYRDKKVGHKRNYFDYLIFKKFVMKKLNERKFDKIIVFDIPLLHFLEKYLIKNYREKYIIDIRDYHKIKMFTNMKKLIENSSFVVISSDRYKVWLPLSDKYVINHNTRIKSLRELRPTNCKKDYKEIRIACIGAISQLDTNISFINSLKNIKNIKLFFHGEGVANKYIVSHIKKNRINNVWVTGRYYNEQEESLYMDADLVDVLVPNNEINSKTCLANRLYKATLYGKPIITLKGTYLGEKVEKYSLGLVLDSFDGIEDKINSYLRKFDIDMYEQGRNAFFESVIKENHEFEMKVEEFIK